MRITLMMAAILLLILLPSDLYIYRIATRRSRNPRRAGALCIAQSALFAILITTFLLLPERQASDSVLVAQMWMLFTYISVYLSKILFIAIDIIASLPTLWHRKRISWLSWAGLGAGIILCGAMWWGALINRHHLQTVHVDISIPELPASFSGYKIAQISDLHTGTFGSDTTFVTTLVDSVNALEPDLIVFTGDIVNRRASELLPFTGPLSRLSAPDGVISILGNHDYGDYFHWESPEEKERNLQWLMDLQIEMGWELLTNSSITIRGQHPSDSLIIIGVENWGDPPFPRYGSLDDAYPTLSDAATKILLTHNPYHWTEEIAPDSTKNIALTLSGHTHAMQIEIAGLSPAAWKYITWGGFYPSPDSKRNLYVNIGSGCVGIPMRLGATPEITLFTLK